MGLTIPFKNNGTDFIDDSECKLSGDGSLIMFGAITLSGSVDRIFSSYSRVYQWDSTNWIQV